MVDMSPEAVGRRLRLMDELWELSVKLMDAKKMPSDTSKDDPDAANAIRPAAKRSLYLQWVAGDGGPLIVMEEALLDCWEGSDAPADGRIVEAESRWGLDVATDYDLACDVRTIAGVVDVKDGKAFVLSTDQHAMATWLPGFARFAGALVEWDYADNENDVVEEAKALVAESGFSQAIEFVVATSPLVLFVAAERGRDHGYARQTFELAPGTYTVRSGVRTTDRTSIVCHFFELKEESL